MNVIAFNRFLFMPFGNFLRYHICGSATFKKYLSTFKNNLPATVPKQNRLPGTKLMFGFCQPFFNLISPIMFLRMIATLIR
mmetsp:Transcript_17588/g.25042  ORF Transcript_17588/g.25042 Transcript_17588/m.25042 type:complete len:81 (+) Transcript_17588:1441-1683(+)